MSEPYGPLLAYLVALRGPVRAKSKPLNVARVSDFGLPELWPGDDSADDPCVRASRVVEQIGNAIDAIRSRNRADGEILHHYFFGTGNENDRQAAAARAAGTKESTPRNYRHRALLGLAEQLHSGALSSRDGTPAGMGAATRDPVATGDAITRALERSYAKNHLDQLARIIVSDAPPIYDATVTLKLKDDALDPDSYRLTLTTVSACQDSRYHLAVSPRATLSDLIMSTCASVTDVFTCSHIDHVGERARAWAEDRRTLKMLSSDSAGRTRHTPLPLQVLGDEERTEVLSELPTDLHSEVALLGADIPRPSPDEPTRVELTLKSRMDRRDHYCFWLADRPTFLRAIIFDAAGMALREGEKFTLQPCLRATAYEPEVRDNEYEIRVDAWIVRGQGALLIWGS